MILIVALVISMVVVACAFVIELHNGWVEGKYTKRMDDGRVTVYKELRKLIHAVCLPVYLIVWTVGTPVIVLLVFLECDNFDSFLLGMSDWWKSLVSAFDLDNRN